MNALSQLVLQLSKMTDDIPGLFQSESVIERTKALQRKFIIDDMNIFFDTVAKENMKNAERINRKIHNGEKGPAYKVGEFELLL